MLETKLEMMQLRIDELRVERVSAPEKGRIELRVGKTWLNVVRVWIMLWLTPRIRHRHRIRVRARARASWR